VIDEMHSQGAVRRRLQLNSRRHLRIRSATPEEAAHLSALALESKALWGYGRDQLDRWALDLTISPAEIALHATYVAETSAKIVGFYQLRAGAASWILEHLWVQPAVTRQGIGSMLLNHALQTATNSAQLRVLVTGDPNAAGFYEREGGMKIGTTPAPVPGDPNRVLPIYEFQPRSA
jgi:GNAT superfamily N-acetyltransferase